ncbi:MAG TPA: VOC family protein [Acidimicrobiales bacterium]|nr:VOC family protein [Acidimicrobiales bacterium]
MREQGDAFHLAVPAFDLRATQHFYVDLLGCKLARTYDDRITVDFFGDQLVCHLTDPGPDWKPGGPLSLYPRHFGVTFRRADDFDALYDLVQLRKVPMFRDVAVRFDGTAEVHRTFVLRDPSDNLVEFKHYRDPRMMY